MTLKVKLFDFRESICDNLYEHSFLLYIFVKFNLGYEKSKTSTSHCIFIFHPPSIGSKKRDELSEMDDFKRSTGGSKKATETDPA